MEYSLNFDCLVFIHFSLAFWHQIEHYVSFFFVSFNIMTSDTIENWFDARPINGLNYTKNYCKFSGGLFMAMQKQPVSTDTQSV